MSKFTKAVAAAVFAAAALAVPVLANDQQYGLIEAQNGTKSPVTLTIATSTGREHITIAAQQTGTFKDPHYSTGQTYDIEASPGLHGTKRQLTVRPHLCRDAAHNQFGYALIRVVDMGIGNLGATCP
jgi:hypothetical protein